MEFVVTINCDNAAFDEDPGYEVGRILQLVAKKVLEGNTEIPYLYDINGNRVGTAQFKEVCDAR